MNLRGAETTRWLEHVRVVGEPDHSLELGGRVPEAPERAEDDPDPPAVGQGAPRAQGRGPRDAGAEDVRRLRLDPGRLPHRRQLALLVRGLHLVEVVAL